MLVRDQRETTKNRLLRSLRRSDQILLEPYLTPVVLDVGTHLEVANEKIKNVYFLERGLATVLGSIAGNDHQAEVGLIGPEGLTGVSALFGLPRSPHDTLVQIEVHAQSILMTDLRRLIGESKSLASSLLRYAYMLNLQVAHTAIANANGKIDERLARWLLMVQDRVEDNELRVTHETIASMLATRRESITVALNKFETAGAVSTSLGRITIEDRSVLQELAAGLYSPQTAK
jgi:CRP-like cAMP-binding protein